MATNNSDKKFKFSENLWEGFDLLVKRTENDLMLSKNILNYFKKKAELEEQHSKKLEKLASKTMITVDESSSINAISFNSSWKKVIHSAEMEAQQHTLLNTSILNKVCQPLQAMIKDMELKRKKILAEGIKLKQDLKDMIEALKKSQIKYEKASKDLESTKIELRETKLELSNSQYAPSESDLNNINKIERRQQRQESEKQTFDEDYREQIKATNDFQHFYNSEAMPKILNDFEHFIISHAHFSKSYFNNLSSVLLELPPAYQINYDIVKKAVDMVDINNDVQEFIRKNIMRKQLSQPFQYDPYIEGKLGNAKKSGVGLTWNTKILSQFSRSGGANASSPGTGSSTNLTTYSYGAGKDEPILPTASYKVALEEIMVKQKDTHPTLEVPYVLVALAENITTLKGHVNEGIFRVPGIISTIKASRLRIDQGDFNLSQIDDVRTSAALLKQWLRDIPTALIPDSLYQQAIDTPSNAITIVKSIPLINQRVLCYLINFLQIFTRLEFVAHSKMGVSNLSMVFAPTILRCPSTDPNTMLNNVGNERLFVETLMKQIPPPLNSNEFLNLPVSMSDAIKDQDDIEELNELDQLSDDDNNNEINGIDRSISPTQNSVESSSSLILSSPTVVNFTNNSPSPPSVIGNSTTSVSSQSTPNLSSLSLNGSTGDLSNILNISTTNPSTASTTTSTPSSPSTNSFTTATTRPLRAPTQSLGWVRVKPAAKPSGFESTSTPSSPSQSNNNN